MKKKKKITRKEAEELSKALQVNEDKYVYVNQEWCSELQMPVINLRFKNGIDRAVARLKELEKE